MTGARHVLHAWEVEPGGSEIISLINHETVSNAWSSDRRELKALIDSYGNYSYLGEAFAGAERKTDAGIGKIHLYKPGNGEREFEGFFMDEDPELESANGIMPFNMVRDVVQRYVYSVKSFEKVLAEAEVMSQLNAPFGEMKVGCTLGYKDEVFSKESYKKALQKKCWKYLFDKMKMEKYVTSGVMKDVNSFVENQCKVPFTMRNIYRMIEIIVGTREESFKRSLVEVIDSFTRHTHENRYAVEGWKTNEGHMLAPKFIIDYMFEPGWSGDMTHAMVPAVISWRIW